MATVNQLHPQARALIDLMAERAVPPTHTLAAKRRIPARRPSAARVSVERSYGVMVAGSGFQSNGAHMIPVPGHAASQAFY